MTTENPTFAEEIITELATIQAPWHREVTLSSVDHESGLKMLRVRIKEGRARFTILDLDAATATQWGQAMLDWAAEAEG